MKDKGYFGQVYSCQFKSVPAAPIRAVASSSRGKERRETPLPGEIRALLLGREGENGEPVTHLLFANCLQLRIIHMPKWHILG